MSTIATKPLPVSQPAVKRRNLSLIVAAGVFVATALFDLIARPSLSDHASHAFASYAFTALLLPFALVTLWALAELRSSRQLTVGPLATTGFSTAAVGLLLFTPCVVASLVTANAQALGPVYFAAMLLSLIGMALFSVAAARAGALPRWAAVALPAAWLFGGPIGEGGVFRGAAILLAAVFLLTAATLPQGGTRAD